MRIVNCILDVCTLGNILIGFVLGILASYLPAVSQRVAKRRMLRRKYIKLEGQYSGYLFSKDSDGNETTTLDRQHPSSDAEIKYLQGGLLSISVKERSQRNQNGE